MKPINVKDNTFINFGKESNGEVPKFTIGDHKRISKYKKIFWKGYTLNGPEEVFVIQKVKNTVPLTSVKIYWNILWKSIAESKENRKRN